MTNAEIMNYYYYLDVKSLIAINVASTTKLLKIKEETITKDIK